jgi:hypothetical protein
VETIPKVMELLREAVAVYVKLIQINLSDGFLDLNVTITKWNLKEIMPTWIPLTCYTVIALEL